MDEAFLETFISDPETRGLYRAWLDEQEEQEAFEEEHGFTREAVEVRE